MTKDDAMLFVTWPDSQFGWLWQAPNGSDYGQRFPTDIPTGFVARHYAESRAEVEGVDPGPLLQEALDSYGLPRCDCGAVYCLNAPA